jgi:hypothetical protein
MATSRSLRPAEAKAPPPAAETTGARPFQACVGASRARSQRDEAAEGADSRDGAMRNSCSSTRPCRCRAMASSSALGTCRSRRWSRCSWGRGRVLGDRVAGVPGPDPGVEASGAGVLVGRVRAARVGLEQRSSNEKGATTMPSCRLLVTSLLRTLRPTLGSHGKVGEPGAHPTRVLGQR